MCAAFSTGIFEESEMTQGVWLETLTWVESTNWRISRGFWPVRKETTRMSRIAPPPSRGTRPRGRLPPLPPRRSSTRSLVLRPFQRICRSSPSSDGQPAVCHVSGSGRRTQDAPRSTRAGRRRGASEERGIAGDQAVSMRSFTSVTPSHSRAVESAMRSCSPAGSSPRRLTEPSTASTSSEKA